MKLIIRTDEFGYNDNFNAGVFEAIENGVITHVETMLDTPGTENALTRMRDYPWISVGWHTPHWFGRPVSDPAKIPSMLDGEGRFKFRHNTWVLDENIRKSVVFEEALIECRAQIERCIHLLGRAPDTTEIVRFNNPVDAACKQVCEEYGITYNTAYKIEPAINALIPPQEKYKDLEIFMPNQSLTAYAPLESQNRADWMQYDPVNYFTEDQDHLLSKKIAYVAFHAGYVDAQVFYDTDAKERSEYYATACHRDVIALCSQELKDWLLENKVELINHRDAVRGTREYQNHLRVTKSPLAV